MKKRLLLLTTAWLVLAAPAGAVVLQGSDDPDTWACVGHEGTVATCVQDPFPMVPNVGEILGGIIPR